MHSENYNSTKAKAVCLINGSLRGKKASSLSFMNDLDRRLSDEYFRKTRITVRPKVRSRFPEEELNKLAQSDAVVFIFPLHNYGLPGALMRLLEDYHSYAQSGVNYKDAKVYVIVNCAFPKAALVTGEAVRVVRNFCSRLSLHWRFAICIGTGPVVARTRKIPLLYPHLKRGYADIESDIGSDDNREMNNYIVKPIIPEAIIAMIKQHYERSGKMMDKFPE